ARPPPPPTTRRWDRSRSSPCPTPGRLPPSGQSPTGDDADQYRRTLVPRVLSLLGIGTVSRPRVLTRSDDPDEGRTHPSSPPAASSQRLPSQDPPPSQLSESEAPALS